MLDPPRYQPSRAFPAYAYVPGRNPHPTRDLAGHSYGRGDAFVATTHDAAWAQSAEYLWGVDLYNHGYFWEAHEAWETLWRNSQGDPVRRAFLQGLIQCAAACLKALLGDEDACRRVAMRGLARLAGVPTDAVGRYMGVTVADFCERFRDHIAAAAIRVEERPLLELG